MRAYVGVTDNDWYHFLAARPEVAEVNFWQPSGGRELRVLAPGEPFFFKTHYPHNRVVGGGFFSDPAWVARAEYVPKPARRSINPQLRWPSVARLQDGCSAD